MSVLRVGLGPRSYDITIAAGCITELAEQVGSRHPASRYCLITDDNVAALHGKPLLDSLRQAGLAVDLISFPAGEQSKNLQTLAQLASGAAQCGLDRKSMFIALGGGVVGDVAGYLAASYMRGVPFIQVPTSLLAQVDSSVGGKTGVDIPEGKNLVGAFYQPVAVYIDPAVLNTLPEVEFRNGMAEVIKHGIIRDWSYVSFLEQQHERIVGLDHEILAQMIRTSCRIKAEVVAEDEKEADIRRILNYGHTIGHAVEAASDFRIKHGFAVAMGMVAAAHIAVEKSLLEKKRFESIISLIRLYKLPTEIPPELDRDQIKTYLLTDKKRVSGKTSYILPDNNGSVVITDEVSETHIDNALHR